MALSFVRQLATGIRSTAGVNSIVLTPSANAVAGDLLVLACNGGGGRTLTACSDTRGNTWNIIPLNPGSSGSQAQAAWTLQNGGALTTSDSVTLTFSGSGANIVAEIIEYSGEALTGTLDQSAVTATPGSGGSYSIHTSGSISNSGELVVGIIAWGDSSQFTMTPSGASAGFQSFEVDENTRGFLGVNLCHNFLSGGSGTQGITWSYSGTVPSSVSAMILTFVPSQADASVNLPTAQATASATALGASIAGAGIQSQGPLAQVTYHGTATNTLSFQPSRNANPGSWVLIVTNHSIISVTGTKSNTYTIGPNPGASGQNVNAAWTWQDLGTLQTTDTITVTYNGSYTDLAVTCVEFTNVGLIQPDASGTSVQSTGTTSLSVSTSSSTTDANDLVLGLFAWRGTAPTTLTADAGFTNIETDENLGTNVSVAVVFQILNAGSLSTKTIHGALSGTASNASGIALAIRPVSSAVNVSLPTAHATASAAPLVIDPTSGTWTNISGATAAQYTPVSGDAGSLLRCLVTGSNVSLGSGGGSATVPTPSSNTVTGASAAPTTGSPTIDDTTPQVGEVINALPNSSTWDGTPPLSFGYQWQHSAGANSTVTSEVFVCLDGEIHVYDPQNNWAQVASYTGLATSDGIRGVTADANAGAAGRIYIGHGSDGQVAGNGSLMCWDIATHSVIYDVAYTHGVDQIAITVDGTQIWFPEGEDNTGRWFVKNASDGSAVATVTPSGANGAHNTAAGLKTGNLYLGSRHATQIDIYTPSRTFVKSIGIGNPGGAISSEAGARPFTFDSNETLLFVTHSDFLGFTVINISTGTTIYTVDLTTATYGSFPYATGDGFTTPSHGVSISPDETQLAVMDVHNSRVHFFDITGLFASPQTAPKRLSSPFIGGATSNQLLAGLQSPCAYDCKRYGWLTHSWDGKYLYVQDTADVFDTGTRQKVGTISTMANTRHGLVEMVSVNGTAKFTPTHFGLGRKSFGQIPTSSSTGWSNALGTGNGSSAYTVAASDLSLQLRCNVTGSNSAGSSSAISTPPTSTVTGATAPTTGSPKIDDTSPAVGQTISALANAPTWNGTPPLTFAYRWQHLTGTGVWQDATGSGNTTQAYTVSTTDAGLSLRCLVTATNSIGSSNPVATPATALVVDQLSAPVNTTPPSIALPEATPAVGDLLVCSSGIWTGDPTPVFSFQWVHSPDQASTFTNASGVGNDTAVYTVDVSDVGLDLACMVTGTNSVGSVTVTTATTPATLSPTQVTQTAMIDLFLDTTSSGGGGGGTGGTGTTSATAVIDVVLATAQPPTPNPQQGSDLILVNLSTPTVTQDPGTVLAQRPRFLRHCGTEVTNMARTYNYLRNGLAGPLFDVSGTEPCAVLFREAGATVFNTPAQDPAPWYDPNRPESAKFLGLILETLEVLEENKTRIATDAMGRLGGAVFAGARRLGRHIYATGSIIATDAEGSDYGLQWLKAVLEGSGCDDCATCVSEVRLSCPPEDGSDDTRGWWRLYNVVLVDGPKKSQTYDLDCAFLLDVEFTLEAGNPYLFKQVIECLSKTELLPDPGPQPCMAFDNWLCGPGTGIQCCTINPPTEVGTVCSIVTIQTVLGVGGVEIAAYNDCPPIPGVSVPVATMTIPSLPAGSSIVLDSGLHQATYIAPDGTLFDGTPYISLPPGGGLGWVEVSDCDPATCICVQTLHPCSGGIDTWVTIETVYREG